MHRRIFHYNIVVLFEMKMTARFISMLSNYVYNHS